MTREEALASLKSTSSHERFLASMELTTSGLPEDIPVLLRARHVESDAYVLKNLAIAISRCEAAAHVENFEDAHESDAFAHARAQATEWIAGILLHEVGSKLGLIAEAASREIPGYPNSRTGKYVQNLQAIFGAIEQLRTAATTSRSDEFDLSELIDEVTSIESEGKPTVVSLVGMRPSVIFGSRHLIQLALANGIRNALEAVSETGRSQTSNAHAQVIVSWGTTDKDIWISVVDDGIGFAGSSQASFGIGKSNKKGHHGFGLAIAKQAVETLGGTISLESSGAGGAKYEIRWKK